jgi:hypothetical protein
LRRKRTLNAIDVLESFKIEKALSLKKLEQSNTTQGRTSFAQSTYADIACSLYSGKEKCTPAKERKSI